jgi:hypothetical protein
LIPGRGVQRRQAFEKLFGLWMKWHGAHRVFVFAGIIVMRRPILATQLSVWFLLIVSLHVRAEPPDAIAAALERGLRFLEQEVHKWPRENGCFSCHNSGDGARALFIAKKLGLSIDEVALEETRTFLAQPDKWHEDTEDDTFKDKKLSAVQFAAALVEALTPLEEKDEQSLLRAAQLVLSHQAEDGAWHTDQSGLGGSPITYGSALATALARRSLAAANQQLFADPIAAADRWLRSHASERTVDVAGLLLGLEDATDAAAHKQRARCIQILTHAQAKSGGWGLFANRECEPFDTAIAVIALASLPGDQEMEATVRRGCGYLVATQAADGSWDETTRPAGNESYAHRVSTTAWATIALLSTRSPAYNENPVDRKGERSLND